MVAPKSRPIIARSAILAGETNGKAARQRGDFDGNGLDEPEDYSGLAVLLAGPEVLAGSGCVFGDLVPDGDLDLDGDVNLEEYSYSASGQN